MYFDLAFPPFTSLYAVLLAFALWLIAFHVLFIWIYPLRKRGWKIIEYVWLVLSGLAVISAVGQARHAFAEAQLGTVRAILEDAQRDVQREARSVDPNSATCAPFVRSEYSPPPDVMARMEADKERACQWFASIAAALADGNVSVQRLQGLPPRPILTTDVLKSLFEGFDFTVDRLQAAESRVKIVEEAGIRSGTEFSYVMMAPLLIAVAFGLRFAKVTGELMLERLP